MMATTATTATAVTTVTTTPLAFVYMVRCADGTLYTGYTDDLVKRLRVHNAGKGAKYTRARRPVVLVYAEEWPDKVQAQKREYQLKQLTRAEKLALVAR